MAKAYILLSGGLDSTTLLAEAVHLYGHHAVTALSIDYGQRHAIELEKASHIADHYQVVHRIWNVASSMGKGGLSDPDAPVPEVDYSELQGVSPTYVPFRNGLLLATITSLASEDPECEVVGYGAHAEDAANWAYPDCTPEFIGAMANAIYIGTYHKIRLFTPYMWSTKSDIIRRGTELRVPYVLTWSCYKGGELHCGTCSTCRARHAAFRTAGENDPTIYMSNEQI